MALNLIPAQSFFDRHFGISSKDLDKILGRALEKRADYADLYFEYRANEAIGLEEGMVKNASRSVANGVGVRVLAESKTAECPQRAAGAVPPGFTSLQAGEPESRSEKTSSKRLPAGVRPPNTSIRRVVPSS